MAARVRRYLTIDGETKSLAEWSLASGVALATLARRVKNGVPAERLFLSPWHVHEFAAQNELWPGANHEPYTSDPMAQACVAEFGAMTLDQVALCFGVSAECVRKIEEHALSKMQRALAAEGKREAFVNWLRERDSRSKLDEVG